MTFLFYYNDDVFSTLRDAFSMRDIDSHYYESHAQGE